MQPGFSFINFLIIIGLIVFSYLGYQEYFKYQQAKMPSSEINLATSTQPSSAQADKTTKPTTSSKPTKTNSTDKTTTSSSDNNQPKSPTTTSTQPQTNLPVSQPPADPATTTPPASTNPVAGFYENKTYFYSLSYPPAWPIRIHSAANVTLGSIPPKNGIGAFTIEITGPNENEIADAKKEASKYPGIITFNESTYNLAGLTASKLTLVNSLTNYTNVYILFNKAGVYYSIKYSEESPGFVNQVEQILSSFKFTK